MISLTRPDGSQSGDLDMTRRGVAALFFSGYAASALSATADPIHTDETGLIIDAAILSPADGFALPAYVARPAGVGRHPAIIVASEIFGVHDYIKDVCRRLAKLGFVAIAPAYFIRAGDPAPLTDMPAVMKIVAQATDPQVVGDIAATLAWLKSKPFVKSSAVAITGFCYGGGVTWLSCEHFNELKCGVAWYGKMAPPAGKIEDANHIFPVNHVADLLCPVLGLYGGMDPLSQGAPAMHQALADAKKTGSKIVVYPDAGHGFHADYRASYNEADAKDGWTKMLAFFRSRGVA